jgi:1-deoxy-D-xylulose-5-phosphate reductoisomerase
LKSRVLSVLGSTGSIGRQTLDVARAQQIPVVAIACAGSNPALFAEQILEFHPQVAAVLHEGSARKILQHPEIQKGSTKIIWGKQAVCAAATVSDANMVVSALVGIAGLEPTLAAIEAKKDIALANKEVLVAGGALVMNRVQKNQVALLPVDSEHSAIFQCLQGSVNPNQVKKIILTASGGPFYGKKTEELSSVTPEQALRHPSWTMGSKITIDSATLMNKGLELIEAMWLFQIAPEQIEIVIQRESVIHSMVEYIDGSIIAQLGSPDMRLPIQYALTYPNRYPSSAQPLDFSRIFALHFGVPDLETFSCLRHCMHAAKEGGTMPAALNGANERAVQLFLQGKISFAGIGELIGSTLTHYQNDPIVSLETILLADQFGRDHVDQSASLYSV